mgnify:CR=1 FL=1
MVSLSPLHPSLLRNSFVLDTAVCSFAMPLYFKYRLTNKGEWRASKYFLKQKEAGLA